MWIKLVVTLVVVQLVVGHGHQDGHTHHEDTAVDQIEDRISNEGAATEGAEETNNADQDATKRKRRSTNGKGLLDVLIGATILDGITGGFGGGFDYYGGGFDYYGGFGGGAGCFINSFGEYICK